MNTTVRVLPAYVLALALLPLGGCLEIAVKTTISADGSSERVISVKRPTKGLPEHGYPLTDDPTWKGEWKETGEKDLPWEYTARKSFATPEALASEYAGAPDSPAARISVSIDRTFEWFYTYVGYREGYRLLNPFNRVPASSTFSPEEVRRIASGEKSDSLNRKIEEWDFENVFEEYFARLSDAVGDGRGVLNRASIREAKGELLRQVREDTAGGKEDEVTHSLAILARAVGARDLEPYRGTVARVMAEGDSMQNMRNSADSWRSSVVMPGLLVSANGESIEGSEVRWNIEKKQLLVGPVEMAARSRVTNAWAFAVTGAVALILLGIAVFGTLRRKKLRSVDTP